MSRDLTAAVAAASAEGVIRPFIAVELTFSTGSLRLNSTDRTLTFSTGASPSDDFLGAGQMGAISVVEESAELKNYSMDMELRGIPNDIVSLALGTDYQGRPARVWMGLLDADYNVIADPTIVFDGLMDSMGVKLGETANIGVRCQSRLARWEEAENTRYTNEEQQAQFPDDKGFEFVSQMVEKEIVWKVG